MTPPRILFGGTFDPVHRAHIEGALAVSRTFDDALVELLPNAIPPHRDQPGASTAERLAMLELAINDHPELAINDWELTQAGPSWTRLTLEHCRAQIGHRPLVLVIGADSLASLQHWRDWQRFPTLCHLAVLPRPDADSPDPAVLAAFPEAPATTLATTSAGYRLMLAGPVMDISATAVRLALADTGDCPMLDAKVLDHIRAHGLYNVTQDTADPAHTRNHNGDA